MDSCGGGSVIPGSRLAWTKFLESIGAGYMFLYQTWVGAQQEWKISEQGPCFELYAADWTPGMPIDLFMPVKR